jgi:hypothetical protein
MPTNQTVATNKHELNLPLFIKPSFPMDENQYNHSTDVISSQPSLNEPCPPVAELSIPSENTSAMTSQLKPHLAADVLSVTSSIRIDFEFAHNDKEQAVDKLEGVPEDSNDGVGNNNVLQFQLIPFNEDPNSKFPLEEVVDRRLKDGDSFKIGRLSSKDAYKKGIPSLDAWFTSKVVSRIHADIWLKDGQVGLIKWLNTSYLFATWEVLLVHF